MAVKTKSNRKKAKARTRPPRAKPLLGRADYVRRQKAKAGSVNGVASNAAPAQSLARMTANTMAMPMRLAGWSFPFEIWRAQALLAYQGLLTMQSIAFGRPMGLPPRMP
jgi:hypothetical protein